MSTIMQSLLIIAKDTKKTRGYVSKICEEKQIGTFDRVYVDLEAETTKTKEKTSIGIAQIKELQKNLYQKPNSGQYKAIIIFHAETLTAEAQNALLKTLEEPPEHALILLLASSKEGLLPTILSRCKIIALQEEQPTVSEKEKEKYQQILQDLPTYGVGKRLKLAQDVAKTKETTLVWLEQMILTLRESIINRQYNNTAIKQLQNFQKTHTVISTTNVGTRIAIEDLLLNM